MSTTTLAPSKCPHCGALNDAATSINDDVPCPMPGDISICFECGKLQEFTVEGPQRPYEGDLSELTDEQRGQIRTTQAFILARKMPKAASGAVE